MMLLRVVDLETTGLAPPDAGVCEIGWADVVPGERDILGTPVSWAVAGTFDARLINPGRRIPPETSAIHHIVDEDVVAAALFEDAVRDVLAPDVDVIAAHSAKFERLWLTDEMTGGRPVICTYKCALRLWPEAPSHSNQALRYWRRPEGLVRVVANVAHRAGPDAYVTAFHLRDLLALAPVEQLIAWSAEPALQVRCHIGKWRGSLWTEVESGFLRWVADRDFDEDVLFTVRHELERREREWERQRDESQVAEEPF